MKAYYVTETFQDKHGSTDLITLLRGELHYHIYSYPEVNWKIHELKLFKNKSVLLGRTNHTINVYQKRVQNIFGENRIEYDKVLSLQNKLIDNLFDFAQQGQLIITQKNCFYIVKPNIKAFLSYGCKEPEKSIIDVLFEMNTISSQ